jgi:biofilm protein TabA
MPDAANEIEEDLSPQKDCVFFKNVKVEMELILTPGMYAIIFQEEVHRPNCQYSV